MTPTESFHAQVCLSEARSALNCNFYAPEYKVKQIKKERDDYIEAFIDKTRINEGVLGQFDEMLDQLPK